MFFHRRFSRAKTWVTPPASSRGLRTVSVGGVAAGAMALGVAFAGGASASTRPAAGHQVSQVSQVSQVNGPGIRGAASGTRSGLAWKSGVYLSNDNPVKAAAFGAWRGRPLDVVEDWSARATWPDIVDPTWLYQTWRGSPYTMAFGVAMLPGNVPGVSVKACANGSYNSHWRQFGSVISSYGLGSSIIRLGWEFNGNWYLWQATQPATWAKCWQQIVTSARSTAPGLQWDWNVNRGVSAGLADPTRAYPGNAYVNMIGVDSYDWWPAATTAAGWQTQLNGTQGLSYWLAFAQAHGKLLAVPEWGNAVPAAGTGGDDPAYVRDMRSFFTANASHLSFEANFQGLADSTNGFYGAATLLPNASAAYQSGF